MNVSSDGGSRMESIEIFVNTLNHSFIAITTFYLTWYCFHVGFGELITYHVWLTTIGYQLLMTEGILAMYRHNTLTLLAHTKAQKAVVHWLLQAIGGLLALIGVVIQIIARFRLGKAHFSLPHSILGLISCVFLVLTVISGCSALFSMELKKYLRPILSKSLHNVLALIAFVTGMISIVVAYRTKSWIKRDDPGDVRFAMAWLVSLIVAITLIGPLKTLWYQARTIAKR